MTPANPDQLTLGVSLDDDANFENFLVAPANQQAVSSLRDPATEDPYIYLWGNGSVGLTHLLPAACHQATNLHQPSLYLSLAGKNQFDPEILTG